MAVRKSQDYRETFVPNIVSLNHPSLQILDKTQTGVFPDFWSVKSLIKEISHNCRGNDGVDMKRETVIKLDKRNKITSKNNAMLPNFDVIVIFLVFGQFGAIWKPNSGRTHL